MKLYNSNFSPNALRVRAVAAELGIPLEIIEVDLRKGEHKTASYLALNPNGKVPVLVDGDFVLWESRAINGYLASLEARARPLSRRREEARDRRPVVLLAGHPSRPRDAAGRLRARDEVEIRHGRAGRKHDRLRAQGDRPVPADPRCEPDGQGVGGRKTQHRRLRRRRARSSIASPPAFRWTKPRTSRPGSTASRRAPSWQSAVAPLLATMQA